jgi:hypothetical protein
MGTLTLADPGVRSNDTGHEYVLSRRPDDLERTALLQRLHSIDLAEPPGVRYGGADVIQVSGLTTRTRPVWEAVLCESLIVTNRARTTAETVGRGGSDFGEHAAEDDVHMVAAVRESFDHLPADLP